MTEELDEKMSEWPLSGPVLPGDYMPILRVIGGVPVNMLARAIDFAGGAGEAPATPVLTAPGALSATEIVLDLADPVVGAVYKIERKTGPGGVYAVVANNVDTFPYSDSGLTPATEYFYRMMASNAWGASEYSNEVSASTDVRPDTIAGLMLWLEAGALALANNDPVSAWPDQSTNAASLSQATSGYQPLFKTAIFADKAAVLFDGVDDRMLTAKTINNILTQSAYTLIVVFKPLAITTTAAVSYANHAILQEESDGNMGMTMRSNSGRYLIQGDNYSGVDKFTEQEIILNTPYIFTQRHGGGNTYLRVNGGPETSFAFGDATFNTAKKISVGAGNTAAANGYLGVLIGYNRSLTSTELDSLIAALRKKYFFLSSPQPFQCFQRSGATGAIAISGWSDITGDIEASFNGGAYQTIVARAVPGPFSGVLSGLTPGTGTLTVRAKSDLTKTTTVGNVMVGDVFILAGQSNPSGRGGSLQTYTASGSLKAAVFNNAYRWTEMKDWVDTNFNQIDVVSNEDPASSPAFGSVWPLVATRYLTNKGVPFAVVPACLGSTSITQHLPGANHQDRATLYGSLVYRALQVGGCKAVLWWQGETDMAAGMAQVNYSTHLNTLANALFADLGVPLIPCKLQHIDSRATEPQQAAINNAIGAAWGTGHILTGPDLSGLDCTNPAVSSDGVHVTTNGGLTSAANLWGAILEALT